MSDIVTMSDIKPPQANRLGVFSLVFVILSGAKDPVFVRQKGFLAEFTLRLAEGLGMT